MTDATVDTANAGIVPRGDYSEVLENIIAEGKCPFCRENLLKHHRHPILRETDYWIVTRNAWPYKGTEHHFLLISRSHAERIEDLNSFDMAQFFEEYRRLVLEYGFTGATITFRTGDTKITGASVRHLHAHVIVGSPRTDESETITGLVGFRDP